MKHAIHEPRDAAAMPLHADRVDTGIGTTAAAQQAERLDHVVPVDIYLPGCPPRPEMLLHAIITLHEKIQEMPLGVNRTEAIRAAEAAALAQKPTIDLPLIARSTS